MTPAGRGPAVELCGASKRFGEQVAVNNVSLRIEAGTKLGLIGVNGAGKSTSIHMLLGLLRPDEGEARILGRNPRHEPKWCRQRVGYVPEAHFIHRWMTVNETIWFCKGMFPSWNDRVCRELLATFRLPENKRVGQLSKGMLAKLSLLLALAHEPAVLILDEPTSGLDPIVREEFLEGTLQAACDNSDRAVLFSSHILSDVERLADSVGILHGGKLLALAATDDLMRSTKRIRLVAPEGEMPVTPPPGVICQSRDRREWLMTVRNFGPAVAERLRHDCPQARIEVQDMSIEDIFRDYVRGGQAA